MTQPPHRPKTAVTGASVTVAARPSIVHSNMAAQEGTVVVIGDTRAETVAAILEWTVEGRAATVSLAPVTAVLGR